MDEERQTVLFTVSREVAQVAIAQVASCEACNADAAEFAFEIILDRVMLFSGLHTDYFMPEPPASPAVQNNGDGEDACRVEWWDRTHFIRI